MENGPGHSLENVQRAFPRIAVMQDFPLYMGHRVDPGKPSRTHDENHFEKLIIGGPQGDAGLTGRNVLLMLKEFWGARMAAVPSLVSSQRGWIGLLRTFADKWPSPS
jgi:hypothetical protein